MAQNLGTQRSGLAQNRGARWPFEDSEMARRIRVFDWAPTPLGAIAGWPENLRWAVDLILGCGFPATLQWGASAIFLYNDAYTGLIGVEHPAALGQPMFTAFPQAREACEPILQHVRGGETVVCEDPLYQYLRADIPEDTRFTMSYSPVRREDGEVAGVLAIGMEKAARATSRESAPRNRNAFRQAPELTATRGAEERPVEQALHQSETKLQLSLDASSMGTFFWYPEEDRAEPDARMLELFGLTSSSELTLASALTTLLHPDDRDRYSAAVGRSLDPNGDGRLREEIRVFWPDGSQHWIAMTAQVQFAGEPPRAVRMAGMGADITERKAAEEARDAELKAVTRLNKLSSNILLAGDLNQILEEILTAIIDLHGADFGNIQLYDPSTQSLRIAVQHGFHQPFLDHFSQVGASEGSSCGMALQRGQRVVIEDVETYSAYAPNLKVAREAGFRGVQSTPIFDLTGKPLGMLSTHFRRPRHFTDLELRSTDLYTRQAGEAISFYFSRQALSESEERLRFFIENVHEYALVQTDLDCKVASWNPGAQRLFGYRSDEIIGQDFSLLLTPEDRRSNLLDEESALLARGERKEDARWFVCKDGSLLWTRWISEPIKDERGAIRGLARVLRDETERLRSETSMRQSEKLAIAGRLASSIAHEVNNPLEAVTNLIFLARGSTNPSLTTRYLDEAERELRRVSLITNEALKFHRQASRPAKVDVAEILDAVLLFHEGRLQSTQVTTERRYRPHSTVTCLPNEIRQVLANLVGNAVDAMAQNAEVRRLVLRVQSASDPRTGVAGVRLTIADTGSGISQTSRKHIFEPFFTTKDATRTGLGLWVSAEIVKKHKGTLRFHSNQKGPSRGTVFSLFLNESFNA